MREEGRLRGGSGGREREKEDRDEDMSEGKVPRARATRPRIVPPRVVDNCSRDVNWKGEKALDAEVEVRAERELSENVEGLVPTLRASKDRLSRRKRSVCYYGVSIVGKGSAEWRAAKEGQRAGRGGAEAEKLRVASFRRSPEGNRTTISRQSLV